MEIHMEALGSGYGPGQDDSDNGEESSSMLPSDGEAAVISADNPAPGISAPAGDSRRLYESTSRGLAPDDGMRELRWTARVDAIVVSLINLPQVIAVAIILSTHRQDGSGCDTMLRGWIMVSAVRKFLSVVLSVSLFVCSRSDGFTRLPSQDLGRDPYVYMGRRLHRFKRVLDMAGMFWFVVGNVWLFESKDCETLSPAVLNLAIAMIIINYAMICSPCILAILLVPILCFCLPCLRLLARRLQTSSDRKGASRDVIERLAKLKFRDGLYEPDESTCSICLVDYRIGEDLRLMPCDHHFHKRCVDDWLKVNATCPNCRAGILERDSEEEGRTENQSRYSVAVALPL